MIKHLNITHSNVSNVPSYILYIQSLINFILKKMCKLKICHAIYKYNVGVIVWQSLIMEIYKKNVCCHELKPTNEKRPSIQINTLFIISYILNNIEVGFF